jgi:hypothetical protein
MIGNVWEWTSSAYHGAHDQHMGNYAELRQQNSTATQYVLKGGSFLCASNFCAVIETVVVIHKSLIWQQPMWDLELFYVQSNDTNLY